MGDVATSTLEDSDELWLVIDARVESLPPVRDALRQWLVRRAAPGCIDDAVLVLDELVSNAARHVGGDAAVGLKVDGEVVLIQVVDADPDFRSGRAERGVRRSGLRIVDSLALRWGVAPVDPGSPLRSGKAVWAEMGLETSQQ